MKLDVIDIELIKFDKTYQRPIDTKHALAISKKLKAGAAKAVSLSMRSNGDLYCYDGQHTIEAFRLAGYSKVPAVIVNGSQEKEAEWFLDIQQNSKRVFVRDAHKAGIVAKDNVSIAAQEILDRYDLKISTGGTSIGKTGAIGAIRRYAKIDRDALISAMDAMHFLWKEYPETWCSVIIRGMLEVAKSGLINEVTIAAKKKMVTPRRILDAASAMQSINGATQGSGASYAKRAIIDMCGIKNSRNSKKAKPE